MHDIGRLREQIDRIDEELVRLLNERATCACAIGELKKARGLAIYQPDREADVLRHVRGLDQQMGGPLGPDAIGRLFERIIDEARRIERVSAVPMRDVDGPPRGPANGTERAESASE
jgi:chorismate mutase